MLINEKQKFYSINEDAEPNRLKIYLKKLFIKFKEIWESFIYWEKEKRKRFYQPIVLKLLFSDLITEIFILGEKPELPQKFPIYGAWPGLFYIRTIFFLECPICLMAIALVHHSQMMY
jgi:hypothetical protein